MTYEERKAQVRSYLGKAVRVEIDRPIGYIHHKEKYDLHYPINYGYIPGIIAGDGEEQDAYILGVDEPVSEFVGTVCAVIRRRNDCEVKWVVVPDGTAVCKEEIIAKTRFCERYFDIEIIL